MLGNDPLGHLGDTADGGVREIEAGLLVLLEGCVESAPPLMPGVGADDREPAGETRFAARSRTTNRRLHGAVQASAPLEKESSVPLFRKRKREADPVCCTCRAGPLVNHAIEAAVRRQCRR